jgi:hypothetical protein
VSLGSFILLHTLNIVAQVLKSGSDKKETGMGQETAPKCSVQFHPRDHGVRPADHLMLGGDVRGPLGGRERDDLALELWMY